MIATDQPVLFDVDTPPVRKPKRGTGSTAHPRWSAYKTQAGAKCDDCLQVLAEAKGEGPATRAARWRRVQGTSDLLLCYGHATIRRAEDGLETQETSA